MKTNRVSALSTAVIAFATILGLITALYYYLESLRTKTLYIWIAELLVIVMILTFLISMNRMVERNENKY